MKKIFKTSVKAANNKKVEDEFSKVMNHLDKRLVGTHEYETTLEQAMKLNEMRLAQAEAAKEPWYADTCRRLVPSGDMLLKVAGTVFVTSAVIIHERNEGIITTKGFGFLNKIL